MAITISLSGLNGDWQVNNQSGINRVWTRGIYSIVYSENMFGTSNAGWIVKITDGVEIFGIKTISGEVWDDDAEIIWNPNATGYDDDTIANLAISVIEEANPIDVNPAYYKCNSVTETAWTGYKMKWDKDNGWINQESLTNNLTISGFIPEKDKVYNVNTTSLIYLYPDMPKVQESVNIPSGYTMEINDISVIMTTSTRVYNDMPVYEPSDKNAAPDYRLILLYAESVYVWVVVNEEVVTKIINGEYNSDVDVLDNGEFVDNSYTDTSKKYPHEVSWDFVRLTPIYGDADTPDLTNLKAENIKYGVTINGVDGTYTSVSVDDSNTPVTSGNMLYGTIAFVNGKEVIGEVERTIGIFTVKPDGTIRDDAGNIISTVDADGTIYYYRRDYPWYESIDITVDVSDIDPSIIKTGSSLFGVNGTFTADATATDADILDGKTAYVNGKLIEGNLVAGSGIEFYECASINSDYHAVAIDGQDEALNTSAGGSNSGAFGVYYPVNLSVNPLQREYKKKDGAYKLSVIDEPDDETMARVAITHISDGVIICSTAPISKNDDIWDVWTGDYWGNMYQGTSVNEFDAEFPCYDARFISYGSGNFLTLSGAGVAAANGVYGRTNGTMDYESSGCAGAWVSEDGKAKLVLSFDWLWDDENDMELPCIYLRCEGKEVYNLHMPDIGWDYEVKSAADLEGYTWVVADDGTTPTPVVVDTAPAWSGYKMTWREGGSSNDIICTAGYEVNGGEPFTDDGETIYTFSYQGTYKKQDGDLWLCTEFTTIPGTTPPDGVYMEPFNGGLAITHLYYEADGEFLDSSGEYWVLYHYGYGIPSNPVTESFGYAPYAGEATPAGIIFDMEMHMTGVLYMESPVFEVIPVGWVKAETPTEGLTAKGYTPEVGKVYSQDTTVYGVLHPAEIPSGGSQESTTPTPGAANVVLYLKYTMDYKIFIKTYTPNDLTSTGMDRMWFATCNQDNDIYILRYSNNRWWVFSEMLGDVLYEWEGSSSTTDPWNLDWESALKALGSVSDVELKVFVV